MSTIKNTYGSITSLVILRLRVRERLKLNVKFFLVERAVDAERRREFWKHICSLRPWRTDILIFTRRVTFDGISEPNTHLLHCHDQNYQTIESQLHFRLSKQLCNSVQTLLSFQSRVKSIHMRRFHSLVCYLSAEVQSSHLINFYSLCDLTKNFFPLRQ